MINEPVFEAASVLFYWVWRERASGFAVILCHKIQNERQKSCSQGKGAQVSIGVCPIQSGQDIGDKTERFLFSFIIEQL